MKKSKQKPVTRSRYNPVLRTLSLILVQALLVQELGSAEGALRFEPKDVVVASDIGTIRKAMSGPKKDIIINIQDAHSKLGAQESIAKILDGLVKNYQLKLIALEGASDVVDTALLSSYPVDEVKQKAAGHLLKEGMISAAEFYSVMTKEPVKLYGVDDPELYKENVEVFKTLVENKKSIRKELKNLKKAVATLEERIYSPELLALVRRRLLQRNGDVKFAEFWDHISQAASAKGLEPSRYPNLSKLSEASMLEKRIDFKKAGEHRNAVINELTGKLSGEDLEKLILRSLEYKKNGISAGRFHVFLLETSKAAGLDPEKYQDLVSYTKYLTLYESTDLAAVFEEAESFESDIKERYFRNENERALSRLSRCVNILTQLLDTTLTSRDYRFYVQNEASCEIGSIRRDLEALASVAGSTTDTLVDFGTLETSIPDARKFYELAERRNALLLENTRKRMAEEGVHVAALVTGGFHSEGISQLMDEDRLSYLVVMPRFDEGSGDRPYIAVLTQRPKEYEEEFKDSDLYVAQPAGFDTQDHATLEQHSRRALGSLTDFSARGKGALRTEQFLREFDKRRTDRNLTADEIRAMLPSQADSPVYIDPVMRPESSLSRTGIETLAQSLAAEAFERNRSASDLGDLLRGALRRLARKHKMEMVSLSPADHDAVVRIASDILSRKKNEIFSSLVQTLLESSVASSGLNTRLRGVIPRYEIRSVQQQMPHGKDVVSGARLAIDGSPTRRTFLELISKTGIFAALSVSFKDKSSAQDRPAVPASSLAEISKRAQELQIELEGLMFKETMFEFRKKIKEEMGRAAAEKEMKKLNQGLSGLDAEAVFVARLVLVNRAVFNEDRQNLERIVESALRIQSETRILAKQRLLVSFSDPDFGRSKEINEQVERLREQAAKVVSGIQDVPQVFWALPDPQKDGSVILDQNDDQVIKIRRTSENEILQEHWLRVPRYPLKSDSDRSGYWIVQRTRSVRIGPDNRHILTGSAEDRVTGESALEVYRRLKGSRLSFVSRYALLAVVFAALFGIAAPAPYVIAQHNEKMARALPGANPPRVRPIKGPKVIDARELIRQTDLFLREAAEQDLKLNLNGVLTRFSETVVDVAGSLDQPEDKQRVFDAWRELEERVLKPRNIRAKLEIKDEKVNPKEKDRIYYFKFTLRSKTADDDLSKYLGNPTGSFQAYMNGGQGARLTLNLSDPRGDGVIVKVQGARRVGFVGDPQGNALETRAAVMAAGFVDASGDWSAEEGAVLILSGDFPDRGEMSREVWLDFQKWRVQALQKGGAVIALKGNHEQMLEAVFDEKHPKHGQAWGGIGGFTGLWYRSGGKETLKSFMGWPMDEDFDYYASNPEDLIREMERRHTGRGEEFRELLREIKTLPYLAEVNGKFIGFHAGMPFEGDTDLQRMLTTDEDKEAVLWDETWMTDVQTVRDFMRRGGWTHAAFGHSPVHPVDEAKSQAKIAPLEGLPNVYSVNTLPGKAPVGGAQGVLVIDFSEASEEVIAVRSVYGPNTFALGDVLFEQSGSGARLSSFGKNARRIFAALSAVLVLSSALTFGNLTSWSFLKGQDPVLTAQNAVTTMKAQDLRTNFSLDLNLPRSEAPKVTEEAPTPKTVVDTKSTTEVQTQVVRPTVKKPTIKKSHPKPLMPALETAETKIVDALPNLPPDPSTFSKPSLVVTVSQGIPGGEMSSIPGLVTQEVSEPEEDLTAGNGSMSVETDVLRPSVSKEEIPAPTSTVLAPVIDLDTALEQLESQQKAKDNEKALLESSKNDLTQGRRIIFTGFQEDRTGAGLQMGPGISMPELQNRDLYNPKASLEAKVDAVKAAAQNDINVQEKNQVRAGIVKSVIEDAAAVESAKFLDEAKQMVKDYLPSSEVEDLVRQPTHDLKKIQLDALERVVEQTGSPVAMGGGGPPPPDRDRQVEPETDPKIITAVSGIRSVLTYTDGAASFAHPGKKGLLPEWLWKGPKGIGLRRVIPNQVSVNLNLFNGMPLPLVSPTYKAFPKFDPEKHASDLGNAVTDTVAAKAAYQQETADLLNSFKDAETARLRIEASLRTALTLGAGADTQTRRRAAGFVAGYARVYADVKAQADKARHDLKRRGLSDEDIATALQAEKAALSYIAERHTAGKFDAALAPVKDQAGTLRHFIKDRTKGSEAKRSEALVAALDQLAAGSLPSSGSNAGVPAPGSADALTVPDAPAKISASVPPTGTFAIFTDKDSITSGSPYAPTIQSGTWTVTYPGFNFTLTTGGKDQALRDKAHNAVTAAAETEKALIASQRADEAKRRAFLIEGYREKLKLLTAAQAVSADALTREELSAEISVTQLALEHALSEAAGDSSTQPENIPAPDRFLSGIRAGQALSALAQKKKIKLEPAVSFQQSPGYGYLVVVNPLNTAVKWVGGLLNRDHKTKKVLDETVQKELDKLKRYLADLRVQKIQKADELKAAEKRLKVKEEQRALTVSDPLASVSIDLERADARAALAAARYAYDRIQTEASSWDVFFNEGREIPFAEELISVWRGTVPAPPVSEGVSEPAVSSFQLTLHGISATTLDLLTGSKPVIGNGLGITGSKTFSAGVVTADGPVQGAGALSSDNERFILNAFNLVQAAGRRLSGLSTNAAPGPRLALLGAMELGFDESAMEEPSDTVSLISVADPEAAAAAIVDARWEKKFAARPKVKTPVLESVSWNGFFLPAKTSIAPEGLFRQGGIAWTAQFNLSNLFSGKKKARHFLEARAAVLKSERQADYDRTLRRIRRLSEESVELTDMADRSRQSIEKLMAEIPGLSGEGEIAAALRLRSELASYGGILKELGKIQGYLSSELEVLKSGSGEIAAELRQALGLTVTQHRLGENRRIAGPVRAKGARLSSDPEDYLNAPGQEDLGARLCGISGTVFPVENSLWLRDGWDGPLPKRMVEADADLRSGMYPLGTDGVGTSFWVVPKAEIGEQTARGYRYAPKRVLVRGTVPQGNPLLPQGALDFRRGSAAKLEEDLQAGLRPTMEKLGDQGMVAVKNGNATSSFHIRKTTAGSGKLVDTQPFQDENQDRAVMISDGRKVNKAAVIEGRLQYDTVVHSAGFEANGDLFKVKLLADGQYHDHRRPELKRLLGVRGNNDVEFMGRMVYLFSSKGIWQDSIFIAYMRNIMMSAEEPMLSEDIRAALETIMQEEFGKLFEEQSRQRTVSDLSEAVDDAFIQSFTDRVRQRILQTGSDRLSGEQASGRLDRFIRETLRAFTQFDPRTAAVEIVNEVADLDISYNMKIEFTDYDAIYLIVRGQPGALVRNTTHPVMRWNSNPELLITNTFRHYYVPGDQIDVFELKGRESNAAGRGGEIVQIDPDLNVSVYSLTEDRSLSPEEVERRWKRQTQNPYNEVPSFSPAASKTLRSDDPVEKETRSVGGEYIGVLDELWKPGSFNADSQRRFEAEAVQLAERFETESVRDGKLPSGPAFLILVSRENTSAGEWYANLLRQSFNALQEPGQVEVMDSHDYFLRVARGWPVTQKHTQVIVLDDSYATIHSMEILFKAGQPNEQEREEFARFAEDLAARSQTPGTLRYIVNSKSRQAGTLYLFSDKIHSNGAEVLGQEFGPDSPFTGQIFTTGFKSGISVSPGGLGALVLNLQEFHLRLLEGLRGRYTDDRQPLGLTLSASDIANLREAFDHFKYRTLPNIVGPGRDSDIFARIAEAADEQLSHYFVETAKVEILKAIHLWGLIGFGATETALFLWALTHYQASLPAVFTAVLIVVLQLVTAARYQAAGFIFYTWLRLTDQKWKAAGSLLKKLLSGSLPNSEDLTKLGRRRSLVDRLQGRTVAFLNPDWHFAQWLSWTHRLGLTGASTDVAAQHANGLTAIEPESQLIRRGTMIFMSLGSYVSQAAASPFITYLRTGTGKGVELAKAMVSWAGAGAFIVGIGPDRFEAVEQMGFHAWISTHDAALEKLLVRPYQDAFNGPIVAHDLINSPMSLIAESVLQWAIASHVYNLSYLGIDRSSNPIQPLASAKVTTPSPLPRPRLDNVQTWKTAFAGLFSKKGKEDAAVGASAHGARMAAPTLAKSVSPIKVSVLPVGILLGPGETEASARAAFENRFGEAAERFELIFGAPGASYPDAIEAWQARNVRFVLDGSSIDHSEVKYQLLTELAKLDEHQFNLLYVAISGLTRSSVRRLSPAQKALVLEAIRSVLTQPAPQEIVHGVLGLSLKPEVVQAGSAGDGSLDLAKDIDRMIAQALATGGLSEALSVTAVKIAAYLDPTSSPAARNALGMKTEDLLLQLGGQTRTSFALTDPGLGLDLAALERAAASGQRSTVVIDLDVFIKDGEGTPFVNRLDRLNAKARGTLDFKLLVRDASIRTAEELTARYPETAVFGKNIQFAPDAATTQDITLPQDQPAIILMPQQGILSVLPDADGSAPLVATLDGQAKTTVFFLEVSALLVTLSGDLSAIHLPDGSELRKVNGVYVFLPPVAPVDYEELLRAVERDHYAQTSA